MPPLAAHLFPMLAEDAEKRHRLFATTARMGSPDVRQVPLDNSYHVITMDHDRDVVFRETHAFISRIAEKQERPARRSAQSAPVTN